ncbi:MAG: DUF2341 domain-containing protein, partial [Verrucomicrobiota bacterium]
QTLGEPLAVDNAGGPTDITPDSAIFRGDLLSGSFAHALIYWGETDGGTTKAAWDNVIDFGVVPEGVFASNITSLLYGRSCFYRAYVTNQVGDAWAPSSVSCKTVSAETNALEGLWVREFDTRSGAALLNPVSMIRNEVDDGLELQTDPIQYTVFTNNFAFLTDSNNFALVWEGVFRPPYGGGVYSFGLNHNDLAILAIDLNGDGNFDDGVSYDPGELIVDGRGGNGVDLGQILLMGREYRMIIAYEQRTTGHLIDARWGHEPLGALGAMDPIDGTSGVFFTDFSSRGTDLETRPVSGVTQTGATLNGRVWSDRSVLDVMVYWGTSDGGTNPVAWDQSAPLGTFSNVENTVVSHVVGGLNPDRTYYFALRGTNCLDDIWSPSGAFVTRAVAANYGLKSKITFCGYDRGTTLTDVPVLVVLGPSIPGFSYAQFESPNGADLRFFDATETVELPSEIEEWDTNGISTVWVNVPALADSNSCIV